MIFHVDMLDAPAYFRITLMPRNTIITNIKPQVRGHRSRKISNFHD